MSARTINAILTHLPTNEVHKMHEWWGREMPACQTLIVYGGTRDRFERLECPERVFVEGGGHLTRDHQRERQSYSGAMQAIASWLAGTDYEFVNFLEYDVLPLSQSWIATLESAMADSGAALLCHQLQRIERTGHPHFLAHAHDPAFMEHWQSVSVRDETGVVLSMLGAHSFWRRDAFEEVAARPEPFPIYLELYMPTLAHHLGYRVRPMPSDFGTMRAAPPLSAKEIAAARAEGALAVHPVKGDLT